MGIALSLVIGVALLPAVLSSGDTTPPVPCGVADGSLSVILATIRTLESGGDYAAESRTSTASGAYQFIDGTWAGYAGYRHASAAPPEVQDAKAAAHVVGILDGHTGDVAAVPVVWYLGHLPAADSPAWDSVPAGGNVLTPREYQSRWLSVYQRVLAGGETSDPEQAPTSASQPTPGSCTGGRIDPIVVGWSLPGPPAMILADPSVLTQPHHDYPAWDWIIPINTPVYAVRGGQVVNIHQWPRNWWEEGCGSNPMGCVPCGVGLTVLDTDGTRWSYCHGASLTVSVGDEVAAGDQVMWSGDSGRSGTAHLHLEIRTRDGVRICPQPLLKALTEGYTPHAWGPPLVACWFA